MIRRTVLAHGFALSLSIAVAVLHGTVFFAVTSRFAFRVSVATAQRVFGHSIAERQVFDDVQIYRRYATYALNGQVPYRDFQVEYPILAFPLFLIPRLLASRFDHYRWYFAVEMLVFDALIVFLVFVRIRRESGPKAALIRVAWYTLAISFLWVLPLSRFDLAPTALAFTGALFWSGGRGVLGGFAAGIGALMKIFPGLVAISGLSTANSGLPRWRGWLSFAITLSAGLSFWAMLGGRGVIKSLGYHLDRGLEVGSVASNGLILWSMARGSPVSTVFRHTCSELQCAFADRVADWSLPVMALTLLLVLIRFRRSDGADSVRYSGAAILGFMITGKVLSPQYLIWLLPFVAVSRGNAGRQARIIYLVVCLLTSVLYPWGHVGLIGFHPLSVAVLTLRNLGLIFLFARMLIGGDEKARRVEEEKTDLSISEPGSISEPPPAHPSAPATRRLAAGRPEFPGQGHPE